MIENYQKVQDYIVKIRRELHQIPELDTNLPQTSARCPYPQKSCLRHLQLSKGN